MKKNELSRIIKEAIFEDMAMDSLDFVEVVMEVEKKTGKCIPDEVLNVKPYHKLTVGELINMLYNYLKDYEKR